MINIENFQESIEMVEETRGKLVKEYFEIQGKLLNSSEITANEKLDLKWRQKQIKANLTILDSTTKKVMETLEVMAEQGKVL